jgi:hypothetical protein
LFKKKGYSFNKSLKYTVSTTNWAPVANACNPSYSGGRDQEDHCWKPALCK